MLDDKRSLREELCGLPQVVIFIFMIFWATGLGSWVGRNFSEWIRDTNPNAHLRLEKQSEWGNLLRQKVDRAKKLGQAYSIPEYFSDLRDSYVYEIKFEAATTFGDMLELQRLAQQNIENGWDNPAVQKVLKEEQDKTEQFRQKLRSELSQLVASSEAARAAKLPKSPPVPWYMWIWGFAVWLVASYGKIAFLSALTYPLRAFGSNGNLSDLQKLRRWIKAIICWPIDLWRYPFDTWREVIAEAELRRSGRSWKKLFGPLSRADRLFVRKVASNHRRFRAWRAQLRQSNIPRWSLVTALSVMLLLLPLLSLASSTPNNDTAKGEACITASHNLAVAFGTTDPDPPWPVGIAQMALAENSITITALPLSSPQLFYNPERKIRPGPIREITHVPLTVQTLVV
ncbi:MAG: hypothetical protein HZB70_02680 [Candidatus Berkelbacteria bacterium]|nr:MAG: hypothetical protein HZB70_02680 [Candidatus Berkelbacteria bacterium]QQG51788.1 MAG: hypothetical protein HY845_00315 [Candidatus Berkelbacteria bacterium]